MAFGQINDDGVVFPFGSIILCQLLPKTANLNANRGIVPRIICRRLVHSVDGDRIFLELIALAVSCFFSKKFEQSLQYLGILQSFAL